MGDAIAIYSRKSRFTGKGESIGNQAELCRAYVRNFFGGEYAERCVLFEDEGFSGGNLNRPAFRSMMEGARNHQFRAIVVYRLDRISRNINDFTGLIDELTKLGVSFVSIREQFDTGTPMGRAMMFIISVFSQLERETIAERIRDNMRELAKTGRWLGGNAPLGFRSEGVSRVTLDGKTRKSFRLAPISEEAEIPKLIFDLYTETDSLTAVEAQLLRRGIRTRQGKDFTRFAIKAILQNPVYMVADAAAYDYFSGKQADVCFPRDAFDGSCGIMAYNRTDQGKGKTTVALPVSRWIIAPGQHPGLIPSGQWIRAQESLERNRSKAYGKPRRNEALLTGLLLCACGERMYPKLTGRKTAEGNAGYTYVCKMKERSKGERCSGRNVSGNLLDAAILERIKTLPEDAACFLARLERNRRFCAGDCGQYERQMDDLRAEYGRNEQTVRGLMDALAMAKMPDARLRVLGRIGELTEENRSLKNRIQELEGLAGSDMLEEDGFDRLRQRFCSWPATVDAMSVAEKRAAVRGVIHKVVWDGGTAHVLLGRENPDDGLPCAHWGEDSK